MKKSTVTVILAVLAVIAAAAAIVLFLFNDGSYGRNLLTKIAGETEPEEDIFALEPDSEFEQVPKQDKSSSKAKRGYIKLDLHPQEQTV